MKKSLSILVVDDHDAMRNTLQDILEDEKHRVFTAASGNEAIQICQEQTFDVILMDVRMPDLNGVEACRKIKMSVEQASSAKSACNYCRR